MRRSALSVVLALCTICVAADESTEAEVDTSTATRCDRIVAVISDQYSQSFDALVARKVDREEFSSAMLGEMNRRFEAGGLKQYGPLWEQHFRAVGDQLAPELIEGYIHYQCRTDTLDVPIERTSDAIDAACWDVADDGKMEILDARMQRKDLTDLKRLSRAKILACITMSLSQPGTK